MFSLLGGIVRFLPCVAAVLSRDRPAAFLYDAHRQDVKLKSFRKAIADLIEERGALAEKNKKLTDANEASDVTLQESTAKIARLQG